MRAVTCPMSSPDHAAVEAIARTITDNTGVDPGITAQQIMAKLTGLGYRRRIEPQPQHQNGPGLPSHGSEGAELLAMYKATVKEASDEPVRR